MLLYKDGTAFPLPPPPLPISEPPNEALVKAAEFNEDMLRNEPYYHGPMTRTDAEKRMKTDGDYLVRRSTSDHVQFVLTGMQDGVVKKITLVCLFRVHVFNDFFFIGETFATD